MNTEENWFKLLRIFLSKTAEKINDHYIFKIILQTIPILWAAALQIWKSWFYDPNGNLKTWAAWIAVVSALVSIFVLIITAYKSKKDSDEKKRLDIDVTSYANEISLRNKILISESDFETRRNRKIQNWIERENVERTLTDLITYACDPKDRINSALDEIRNCLSDVSGISTDKFYISAAISVSKKNTSKKGHELDWIWLSAPPIEGTLDIPELLKPGTMFRGIVDGKPFLFANDKKKASEDGSYLLDEKDNTYGGEGSILCFEIADIVGNVKVRMIISISTYAVKIIRDEESEDTINTAYKDRIQAIILHQFEGELHEDMLWYILYHAIQGKTSPHWKDVQGMIKLPGRNKGSSNQIVGEETAIYPYSDSKNDS